ncbi:MAG: YjgP/YjgQ family permease [Verrucomicrobia bacterium]|jgi:lipopolysaccharide export system permease protein|nr:YjgP/YjgQ family permease [Verrucomicrobiota bacterium]
MKLIDKHLLREFLIPLTYCLLGFGMIIVVSELFGDVSRIMAAKPPWHVVVRFYISVLGPSMQYLVPASLMLATLYTLYGLTNNNELVAMRASGISIYRIMVPFLGVGIAFSLATAALNETWIPHAMQWAHEMRENKFWDVETRVFDQCIYLNPVTARQWIIKDFDTKNPRFLKDVEVKQETPEGLRQSVITAKRGDYLDGQWWFHGPRIQHFGPTDNPVGDVEPLGADADSIVEMRDYDELPSAFVSTVRPWAFLNIREMFRYLRLHEESLSERARAEKRYAMHSHLSGPWACLIVILFAIPAGTRTGRQGMLVAVFTAIGLLASFYTLAQMGLIIGSTGLVPPAVGAWLANGVFCVIGLVMMARIR